MRTRISLVTLTIAVTAVIVVALLTRTGLAQPAQPALPADVIAIRAARVLDGTGQILENATVDIRGSTIIAIDHRTGPVTYDLGDRTLMPGLIDVHVHIGFHFRNGRADTSGETPAEAASYAAENAWLTLVNGFTTVQSVGAPADKELRDAIARGVLPGPRILTSLGSMSERTGGPDAIRAYVRKTKADGADVIKAGRIYSAMRSNGKTRIVLVGDSTVTDASGWGLGFKQLVADKAEVFNRAANGRSSKSYVDEGRWREALALKGDYYVIQFGHNDQPGKGPERETDPATTYRQFMARYVDDARAIGAKPILVTSLTRRIFDPAGTGRIARTLGPWAEAVKALAAEKHVPVIDLHTRSIAWCESLGEAGCSRFNITGPDGKPDRTHLDAAGSLAFARLVVDDLRKTVPELAPLLRDQPVPAASIHVEESPSERHP